MAEKAKVTKKTHVTAAKSTKKAVKKAKPATKTAKKVVKKTAKLIAKKSTVTARKKTTATKTTGKVSKASSVKANNIKSVAKKTAPVSKVEVSPKPASVQKPFDKAKVRKVMREFKEKELRSGSKAGPKVKDRKQAIAIALSEGRKAEAGKRKVKKVSVRKKSKQ